MLVMTTFLKKQNTWFKWRTITACCCLINGAHPVCRVTQKTLSLTALSNTHVNNIDDELLIAL